MFPGGRELVVPMSKRFVVTGGPGGGKTTLLDALAARGHRVAPEAARRIIKKRLAAGLPEAVPAATAGGGGARTTGARVGHTVQSGSQLFGESVAAGEAAGVV